MTSYAPAYGPPADPTNVVGRRIGAWFIDVLLSVILVVAAVALSGTFVAETVAVGSESLGNLYCEQWNLDNNGICSYSNGDVVTVTLNQAYFYGPWLVSLIGLIVIQGVTGGSLGKLAVGLRVVDEQGQKAGIGRSAVRTLLWVVDGIVCGLPVLGGVLMVSTKGHRRVGDMAAKTFVVDKNQVGHPPAVPGLTSAWPGVPGGPGGYPPAGGWGQPQSSGQPQSWGQAPGAWQTPAGSPTPGVPSAGEPAERAQAAPTPTGEGPTWDAARNAYIQYDRDQSAWVQWDATSQQWRPIDQ